MKVCDLILNHVNRDYLLPSIQREFVWLKNPKEKKIEKLFDSLLQEYPIGTILTWAIDKEPNVPSINWEVYKFVEDYDMNNPRNSLANTNGYSKLFLLLDGQQRVTALRVGLKGSFSYTLRNRIRTKKLYLNLFANIEDEVDNNYGLKYQFEFLEAPSTEPSELWFEVGKVLDYRDKNAEDFKEDNDSMIRTATSDTELIRRAKKTLGQLHKVICNDEVIQEKMVTTDDDEKVLNIFVRTNDGGIKLEKADLLLSYMESNNELFTPNGARQEIFRFTDFLNKIDIHKPNYQFSKDDVLKSCLVLSDLEVQYKIKNFNTDNLLIISNHWEVIKKCLGLTTSLIARYGFMPNNIISRNALIPIAYYLKQKFINDSFIASETTEDLNEKNEIIKWLIIAQLTGAFGSASDTTLKNVRSAIQSGQSFNQINLRRKIQKEDVEKRFDKERYGSKLSHLILMLISDTNRWEKSHQDHIFPISKFTEDQYQKMNLSEAQKEFYNNNANSLANLHLLNPYVNISKSNDDFIDWSANQNASFLESSIIPKNISLDFKDFENFIRVRRAMIIDNLYNKLK